MAQQTDEQLLAEIKKGDMAALGMLVERYKLPLYNFIFYLVKDRSRADDVFQEVFLKVVKGIKGYTHEGRLQSWLFRIANNMVVDIYRKEKRHRMVPLEKDRGDGSEWSLQPVDTASSGDDPEREMSQKQLKERLENAVEKLPFEQKQVFLMRTRSELSFKEISKIVKCPMNTALGRMRYALLNLRKCLEEDGT